MSWVDRVKNDLIITTGDGKQYKPKWKNASRVRAYNFTEFTFSEVDGSLVDRKRPIGVKYNIELYFDGADHIEESNAFEISARDRRPWEIDHPLYDKIFVQPTELNFDNSQMNVTRITGVLFETLLDDNPKVNESVVETIGVLSDDLQEILINSQSAPYDLDDINSNQAISDKSFKTGETIIEVAEAFEEFNNLYNTSKAAMSKALLDPVGAITDFIPFLYYPGTIAQSLNEKLAFLKTQFNAARENILDLFTVSSKQNYVVINSTTLSSIAVASTNPQDDDYKSGNDVIIVINLIFELYLVFLNDLDQLQTDNGGDPDSFVADPDSIIQLNQLIFLTISNLFQIALDSRQERSIILEADSNLINLAHRFYVLDDEDNNLNEFIETNEIGLNELIQIKKGRKILYYTPS